MATSRRLSLPASLESKEENPTKMDEKSIPRYLQSSSSSCHDLCKYGKHHPVLEKPHKKPFPRKKPISDQIPSAKKPSSPQIHDTKPSNASKPPPHIHSPLHQTTTPTPMKSNPTKKPPPFHPKVPKSSSKVTTPSTPSSKHSNKPSKKNSSAKSSPSSSSRSSPPSKLPEEKTLYVVTDDKVAKDLSKEFSPEEKKAIKLGFRRDKVVELSAESKAPRRMPIRRRKAIGSEEVRSEVRLKFKGVVPIKEEEEIEAEKVVLRHQDVQGKKDAQGLFNNVIEETASKLVESQKSKVKALVGAFETVISLQDGSNNVP